MYEYSKLPTILQDGMKRYVEDGVRTGGFLTACLENDLAGAVNRADKINLLHLQDIVKWIYWEAPHDCWGSKEKVAKWHGDKTVGEINRDIQKHMKRMQERIR